MIYVLAAQSVRAFKQNSVVYGSKFYLSIDFLFLFIMFIPFFFKKKMFPYFQKTFFRDPNDLK